MTFPLWSIAPFLLMLASIAVAPLMFPAWWDKNTNKLVVSVGMSIPVLALLLPAGVHLLTESLVDYSSFIILLGALFVIAGGIYIKGEFAGTPLGNTAFLAVGALLSNVIGTTGASMLLIRPFLRANHTRQRKKHLAVFFIFVVSNIGGLLTPLGDPPLFLGFLRGIPFQWTLNLLPIWGTALGAVLLVFNLYDQYIFVREDVETPGALAQEVQPRRRLHVEGKRNFFCFLGVMLAAIFSGYFGWPRGIQETIMLAMALLSWLMTPRRVHESNHFHFHPITEVAAVFIGIFVTMIPALEILRTRSTEFGIHAPWQFFWLTGGLSGFLDNAPAYLTFTSMAVGLVGGNSESLGTLLQSDLGVSLLRAVSAGAVLMGANTYIGNGPNFMVKSIAEHHRIEMPSFGGYMLYSMAVLIPIFVVVTLIFFR